MPLTEWLFDSRAGNAVLGVIVGAVLAYIPRLLGIRRKAKACRESLIAEIKKCDEMANGFLKADPHIPAPSYRLPTNSWSRAFPELLGIGVLNNEDEIKKLYDFYIHVDSLNRGLDQAHADMIKKDSCEREDKRNILKANHILENFDNALKTAKSIPTWFWIS